MQQVVCGACGQVIHAICPASKRLECEKIYPGIKCDGYRCLGCCIRGRNAALIGKKTEES